ncbi:hypothetical protein PP178_01245 [Zeaxanthinibacter sp. PT1]|uniref:hypothetical protein n=1 Tax=Zeaxanthinibacter TaxID=561554 RepID=UPI0023492C97|nr:hypothetical protein [Zeaxanthinibacter sp. PT1]MDC6350163.1 hypothetical protein [Zeaxanthinibacter sp. PT1]
MRWVPFFFTVVLMVLLLFAIQRFISDLPTGEAELQAESEMLGHDHMGQMGNKNWCELLHDFVKRSAEDGAFLLRSAGDIRITGLAPGFAIVLIELQFKAPKTCDTHPGPCSPGSGTGGVHCSYSVIKRPS